MNSSVVTDMAFVLCLVAFVIGCFVYNTLNRKYFWSLGALPYFAHIFGRALKVSALPIAICTVYIGLGTWCIVRLLQLVDSLNTSSIALLVALVGFSLFQGAKMIIYKITMDSAIKRGWRK